MARILLRDLTPGTSYLLQFRTNTGDGVSDWSQFFSLTTESDLSAPTTPAWAPLSALVADGTSFIATWQEINFALEQNRDFAYYELELSYGGKTFYFKTANVFYVLTFEENNNLWGIPVPIINARIRAVDLTGNASAWSASIQATNPVPTAPASITGTVGTDQIALKWEASISDDVIGYRVYTGSASNFTPASNNKIFEGNALSYSYTSTTYAGQWFKVVAVDVFGQESPTTATGAALTPNNPFVADVAPPANPAWTSATNTNNGNGIGATTALVWTQTIPSPDDLAGFEIRYREGSNAYNSAGTFAADARTASVSVPKAFTAYEFSIRSYDKSRNYSAWVITTAAAVANTAPGNVAGLAVSGTPSSNAITYNWTALADADIKNYEVTFSTSATFASGNITFLMGESTTLTVSGLSANTTYYARVRAVDNAGAPSAAWSSTVSAITSAPPTATPSDGVVPGVPTAPGVVGGLSYLYVTWSPVTLNASGGSQGDVVTYEVHLSDTTGFTPVAGTKVTEIAGTSAIIDNLPGTSTPLSYGTPYFVKLVAKDRDGTQPTASGQGSGSISKVASTDVISIGADLIVPGTGFVSALVVASGGSIQSSNYNPATPAGWKIGTTGIDLLDIGSTVKVEALEAGVIGGASGAGLIDVAAGTALRLNGGHLRSNTYTYPGQTGSTYVYDANATAGFYLGDDGLVIAQGAVKASTLISGDLSTASITLSDTAEIKTIGYNGASGFRLSNTNGLEIPNNSIAAAKLIIGSTGGNNLWTNSSFEKDTSGTGLNWFDDWTVYSNDGAATASRVFGRPGSGTYAARIAWSTASAQPQGVHRGIPGGFKTGTTYSMSWWAKGEGNAIGRICSIHNNAPAPANVVWRSNPALTSDWQRYAVSFTRTDTTGNIYIANLAGAAAGANAIIFDDMQIEESEFPSAYAPKVGENLLGFTIIDGGMISTGAIHSTNKVDVNGVQEWVWNIPVTGAATFTAMRVLGNTVLGNSTTDSTSLLSASNYRPGVAGWQLRGDGTADLRGLEADSISGVSIEAGTLSVGALNSIDPLGAPIVLGNSGSLVARNASNGALVGISGTEGFFVRGPIESGKEKGDTFISFPILPDADGNTAPNIISGVLTATTLAVNGDANGIAASLYQKNYLELSSTLTLRNQTAASSASPTPTVTWAYTGITPSSDTWTQVSPVWANGTANTFTALFTNGSANTNSFAARTFNSAGTQTASTTLTGLPTFRAVSTGFNINERVMKNLVQIGTNWYSLVRETGNLSGAESHGGIYIYIFNSSFAYTGSITIANAPVPLTVALPYLYSRTLGADGTQLLFAQQTSTNLTITPISTAGVSGTVVTTGYDVRTDTTKSYGALTSVLGTSADFGSAKWLVTASNSSNVNVFSTAGVRDANLSFPSGKYLLNGITWNAAAAELRFVGTTTGSIGETGKTSMVRYSKITWTTETSRWAASTTRYDSVGNYETSASPQAYFTMQKRAWISVTSDSGTSAAQRTYFGRKASGTLLNTELWRQTATLGSGISTVTYDTALLTGSNPGGGALAYPSNSGAAAKILSQATDTASGSTLPSIELRGDGYARIREIFTQQALFQSPVDATNTAGNLPPVRIGPPTGGHLRIDGDEIIAMDSDTVQGALYLNDGGVTFSTRMVLQSTTEANTSAGNAPPLRVGNVASTHLRIDSNEIIAMSSDASRTGGMLELSADTMRLNLVDGALEFVGSPNHFGKIRTTTDAGTGLSFWSNRIIAGVSTSSALPNASNTTGFDAARISSWTGGIFMEDLLGGGNTTAGINNAGKIIRASNASYTQSSIRFKENVETLTLEEARGVLNLRSVTFQDTRDDQYEVSPRVAGFIAEEAAETGTADFWVGYDPDTGEPGGFRYDKMSAAHNVLIKELTTKNETLEERLQALEALVARLSK